MRRRGSSRTVPPGVGAPAGEPSDPAHRGARSSIGRRAALGLTVAVAAAALAILPGWGRDEAVPPTPAERAVQSQAVPTDGEQRQPPTIETVRGLAAQLSAGDQPIDADTLSGVVTSPGEFQALGRLSIPAIGLDVEVGNGVDPATLVRGPGHWPGTPVPGQAGNAVVSGHRTTNTAPFRELDELAPGDPITTTNLAGATTTYVVTEVLVVPVEVYTTEVLTQPTDPDVRELTLFACHPEGSLTHRIVVHALADAGDS